MGLAFSVVGVSMLIGTPIFGALLNTNASGSVLVWWRALVFAGVGTFRSSSAHALVKLATFTLRIYTSWAILRLWRFNRVMVTGMHVGRVLVHGGDASSLLAAITVQKRKPDCKWWFKLEGGCRRTGDIAMNTDIYL